MQPDNEKIIEAIASHQEITRKLMQDLIGYGATPFMLEGLVQIMKVLDCCYEQPHHNDMVRQIHGIAGGIQIGGNTNSDEPFSFQDFERFMAKVFEDYQLRQNSNVETNQT